MQYRTLGATGLEVSILGYGASPLGGVFGSINEADGVRAVREALDLGVNIIDASPYYGITRAETVLGRALHGLDRSSYVLATKVGRYGEAEFDFTADRVRRSVEESLVRLDVDHIDVIQCHDIEFASLDQIVDETIPALYELRDAGKVRFVGITGYPLPALASVAGRTTVDTVLSYCRYSLLDDALTEWPAFFADRQVAVMNASPLAMGALTCRGAPGWHPAPASVLAACAQAAELCDQRGVALEQLALRYAVDHPGFATTFVGSASASNMRQNVRWALDPLDSELLAEVAAILAPVHNHAWHSGRTENNAGLINPYPSR
jgi:aryl-alcohol dehydrogenase-like predicted oxidoreductase